MKISGEDKKIFEELFDKALKIHKIEYKRFVDLDSDQAHRFQLDVTSYIDNNIDPEKINEGLQQNRTYYSSYNRGRFGKYRDRFKSGADEIAFHQPLANSLSFYATKGKIKTWEAYKSHILNKVTSTETIDSLGAAFFNEKFRTQDLRSQERFDKVDRKIEKLIELLEKSPELSHISKGHEKVNSPKTLELLEKEKLSEKLDKIEFKDEKTLDAAFLEGFLHFKNSEYNKALDLLKAAYEKRFDFDAGLIIAYIHCIMGDYQSANDQYTELNTHDLSAYENAISNLYMLDLHRVMKSDASSALASQMEKIKASIAELEKDLSLENIVFLISIHTKKAKFYFLLNDFDRALEEIDISYSYLLECNSKVDYEIVFDYDITIQSILIELNIILGRLNAAENILLQIKKKLSAVETNDSEYELYHHLNTTRLSLILKAYRVQFDQVNFEFNEINELIIKYKKEISYYPELHLSLWEASFLIPSLTIELCSLYTHFDESDLFSITSKIYQESAPEIKRKLLLVLGRFLMNNSDYIEASNAYKTVINLLNNENENILTNLVFDRALALAGLTFSLGKLKSRDQFAEKCGHEFLKIINKGLKDKSWVWATISLPCTILLFLKSDFVKTKPRVGVEISKTIFNNLTEFEDHDARLYFNNYFNLLNFYLMYQFYVYCVFPCKSIIKESLEILADTKSEYQKHKDYLHDSVAHYRKQLVDIYKNLNFQEIDMTSSLFNACEFDYLELAEEACKKGADVNTVRDLLTPLHIAIINNNVEMIKLLLKFDADRNLKNSQGVSPLILASRQENPDLMTAFH